MRKQIMKYIVFFTLLFTLAFAMAPALTPPFTGFTADQLPIPQIQPPIQPATYTFAVWGLIYPWLIVSAVFGVLKRRDDAVWAEAQLPLIASLALGVPWLAIANADAIWATVVIMCMAVGATTAMLRAPAFDRWFFLAPVGVYAGWLTAASAVSLGSTAAGYGFLFDDIGWALAGIAIALVTVLFVTITRQVREYLLTVIWALVGIIMANGTGQPIVTACAALGCIVLIGIILRNITRQYSF